ncbi:uncharacterized protein LOC142990849 [Genypterus blacodes]|uniref:uncharacterized protein LOC142990849 n=1 Tax=Genypterus blacodes TaxID=154954 RepID=UPI003F7763A9
MERRRKRLLCVAAFAAVKMLECAEKRQAKRRRVWRKTWLERWAQRGLYSLHGEAAAEDSQTFLRFVKMTGEDFQMLFIRVAPMISKQDTQMRKAISAKERLSLTRRFLATGESFKSLSHEYRMGASTAAGIVIETCKAIHEALRVFLQTPSTEAEWRKAADGFLQKWQFPHCLGAIDGKRISIQPPGYSGNTPHITSVPMMAVVDANYKFLYLSAGAQASASETGLFAESDFRRALDRHLLNLPSAQVLPNSDLVVPYMFVGDEGYPLRLDVMKPYPSVQIERDHRVFNYRLSRACRVAENAFGILANQWRVFRSTIMLHPDKVVSITMAAVCLHNFLRGRQSGAYLPVGLVDREDSEHRLVEGTWRSEGLGAMHPCQRETEQSPNFQAIQQRNALKQYFLCTAGLVPWQEDC